MIRGGFGTTTIQAFLIGLVVGSLFTGALAAQGSWKDDEHKRIYDAVGDAENAARSAESAARSAQLAAAGAEIACSF